MELNVGTRRSYLQQTDRMSAIQSLIQRLQTQISTGKKLIDPSDDPVAAARVAQIQRSMDDNTQFMRNIDTVTSRLSLADGTVESMSNSIIRVQELALNAANGTLTNGDRQNIAAELDQVIDGMMALANTRDAGGDYIFGGTLSDVAPYAKDMMGAILWQGGASTASIAIGPDTVVRAGERGDDVLTVPGATGDTFALLAEFRDLLSQPTPLTAIETERYAALLTGLQGTVSHLNDMRATFGGRLNTIEAENVRLKDVETALTVSKSNLESVDVAEAITEMQSALLILKASQQSFAQVKSLSLFDVLR